MSAESEAISNLPGHISSFTTSFNDESTVNDTDNSPNEGKIARQLLLQASQLATSIPELRGDAIKSVTVVFPGQYHSYTVGSNDTIYGIVRENEE